MGARGPHLPRRGNSSREYTVLLVLVLVTCVAAVRYLAPEPPDQTRLADKLMKSAVGLLQCFGIFVGVAVLLASYEFVKQAVARRRGGGGPAPPAGSPPPMRAARRALRFVLLLGACLVALLVLVVVLPRSPSAKRTAHTATRDPIRVDPARVSLARVLDAARPGDHFLLEGDVREAHVFLRVRDVAIEPAPGVTVVWKAPAKMALGEKLLNIQAPHCTLRDISFDGGKKAEGLIGLSGMSPGVKLELLRLTNFTKCGVWATNCSGTEANPVTFRSVRFVTRPGQAGVLFDYHPALQNGIGKNAYFAFRDCFFEGTGSKLETPDAAFVDQTTFDLPAGTRVEVGP